MGNSKAFTRDQKNIYTYLDKELLVLENKSISLPRRTSILSSNSILFMSLAARVASWALRYSTDSNWDRVLFRYVFNKSEEATTDTELIAIAADLKNKRKQVKTQIWKKKKKIGNFFFLPHPRLQFESPWRKHTGSYMERKIIQSYEWTGPNFLRHDSYLWEFQLYCNMKQKRNLAKFG